MENSGGHTEGDRSLLQLACQAEPLKNWPDRVLDY
jgi:hypothetical protein